MTDYPEKLRLKALAEEDIYFAKRDRELIRALHERKLAMPARAGPPGAQALSATSRGTNSLAMRLASV